VTFHDTNQPRHVSASVPSTPTVHETQTWGAAAAPALQPGTFWSGWKVAVAVVIAAGIAAGGTLTATSASSSSSSTSGSGGGKMPGSGYIGRRGGPGGGGPGGGLGGAAGLTNALHGELVVADPSGTGTTTELVQNGTVSHVSASSITAKSSDKTYTITSSTTVDQGNDQISNVKTGHTVAVIASQAGSATNVADRSLTQSGAAGNGNAPRVNG
jgi:hypothetical protein